MPITKENCHLKKNQKYLLNEKKGKYSIVKYVGASKNQYKFQSKNYNYLLSYPEVKKHIKPIKVNPIEKVDRRVATFDTESKKLAYFVKINNKVKSEVLKVKTIKHAKEIVKNSKVRQRLIII